MKKHMYPAGLAMAALAAVLAAALLPVLSCSTEAALQRLFGADASAPVFLGCRVPAEGEAVFDFSRPVQVSSLYLDPPMETEVLAEGNSVTVRFASSLPGGSRVTADLLVEDKDRNTLAALVAFRTRNSRVPGLVINEIKTEYNKPKVEFVELRVLEDGNLGALRLFAAGGKEEPVFEFPPVEVKKGAYVVVHGRSVEEGLKDETGSSTSESRGAEASAARDFWIPGSVKTLHKTDAVYVMDQDNRIIDGVLLDGGAAWKPSMTAAAEEMTRQGAWSGGAAASGASTATRTMCRSAGADSNSARDWYVTVTSGATPGKANNPARYAK
ncbi:MAG: hypothetical protein LBD09_07195 [Treponema sp.]|jgi:hypothetical protein|nr:hypothetical protein [Treponema sp.]